MYTIRMSEEPIPQEIYTKRGIGPIRKTFTEIVDYRKGISRHNEDMKPLRGIEVIRPPLNNELLLTSEPVTILMYDKNDPLAKAMAARSIDPRMHHYYAAGADGQNIAQRIATHNAKSVVTVGIETGLTLDGVVPTDATDFQTLADTLSTKGLTGSRIAIIPMRTSISDSGQSKMIQGAFGKDIGILLKYTQEKIAHDPSNKAHYLADFYKIVGKQFDDLGKKLTPDDHDDTDTEVRYQSGTLAFSMTEDVARWFLDQREDILFDQSKPLPDLKVPTLQVQIGSTTSDVSLDTRVRDSSGFTGPQLTITRPALIAQSGFPERERIVVGGFTDSVGRQVGRTIYERYIPTKNGDRVMLEQEIDTPRSLSIVSREVPKITEGRIVKP